MTSPAIARIAPFAAWIACMALETLLAQAGALGWTALAAAAASGWGYAVRTVLVAGVLAFFWRGYAELRPGTALRAGPLAEALAAGLLVFGLWITVGPLLTVGEASRSAIPVGAGGTPDLLWLALRLAGTALVVPVIEELFWRSYLMRRIDAHDFMALAPARVSATAMLVSSVIFAAEHRELAAGFLAGLVFAWLYRRHGDLRLAILAHGVTNALLGAYVLATAHYEFW